MKKLRQFSFDSKCLDLARHFFPDYSEQVLCMIAQGLQDVVENHSLEHSWNCPGEECRYWRAVMEGNARDWQPLGKAAKSETPRYE